MGFTQTPRGAAGALHAALSMGAAFPQVPPPVGGLVCEPGEYVVGVFGVPTGMPLDYARFTEADVVVGSRGPTVVVGTPPFLVGYALGSVVMHRRARKRMRRLAQPQWRSRPLTYAVVTTRRLWCETAGEWKWFNYDVIVDLRLDGDALAMSFAGQAPPVRLAGAWAPWIAVAIAHLTFGRAAHHYCRWLSDVLPEVTSS